MKQRHNLILKSNAKLRKQKINNNKNNKKNKNKQKRKGWLCVLGFEFLFLVDKNTNYRQKFICFILNIKKKKIKTNQKQKRG